MNNPKKIILFDGVCNLCNASINWIIDHDTDKIFSFASLQSEFAKSLWTENEYSILENEKWISFEASHKKIIDNLESVILLDEKKIFLRSDAIIEIGKSLKVLSMYQNLLPYYLDLSVTLCILLSEKIGIHGLVKQSIAEFQRNH